MRKKQQQEIVRPITTGHVEADMLGTVYLWISERKNRGLSQRPHRNKLKGYTFLSKSEVARMIQSRTQTAPSACLRSLKVLKGKGKEIYNRVASRLRKLFVNGK
jgi:hypothetical protein